VLITGGTGTLGRALAAELIRDPALKDIRIFSRGAGAQVAMRRELSDPRLTFVVGDVRDRDALQAAMRDANLVFHLAALKDVQVCEENPREAILTNINGTQNVVDLAIAAGAGTVIFSSSDKAAAPFSLYGVTKACGEKVMAYAHRVRHPKQRFISVRLGNVLGSSASVVPHFREQIRNRNCMTVTDLGMTRYVMTVEDATALMLHARGHSQSGEILIRNMSAVRLDDVAAAAIGLFGNAQTRIEVIGARSGDKKHEVLMSEGEEPFSKDLGNGYFVILPQSTFAEHRDQYAMYPCVPAASLSSETAPRLDTARIEGMIGPVREIGPAVLAYRRRVSPEVTGRTVRSDFTVPGNRG
jgi:UDP-N-acetylglucosamine 4,6-dehydratase/5-epimerase